MMAFTLRFLYLSAAVTIAFGEYTKQSLVSVELWNGKVFTELKDVQQQLSRCRANVLPFALTLSPHIQELFMDPGNAFSPEDAQEIKNFFLLDRKELVQTIRSVRETHSIHGGFLETTGIDSGGYEYPTIFIADDDQEIQGFDTMHFNAVDDAGLEGADEVMTLVRGSATWYYRPLDGGLPIKFTVAASAEQGWKVTYDGAVPHAFQNGPSLIMPAQIVGPKQWTMRFRPELENPWVSAPASDGTCCWNGCDGECNAYKFGSSVTFCDSGEGHCITECTGTWCAVEVAEISV